MNEEQAYAVFSRLVLQNKIREAVRFITDRAENGGILQPDDDAGKGKSGKEVLEEKHPDQTIQNLDVFLFCDVLPTMVDVDVTTEHVQKVANSRSYGAGVSALDAAQWKNLLLKQGGASANLRESMAALMRLLANSIVEWDYIQTLKAKKVVTLVKCPGCVQK